MSHKRKLDAIYRDGKTGSFKTAGTSGIGRADRLDDCYIKSANIMTSGFKINERSRLLV